MCQHCSGLGSSMRYELITDENGESFTRIVTLTCIYCNGKGYV